MLTLQYWQTSYRVVGPYMRHEDFAQSLEVTRPMIGQSESEGAACGTNQTYDVV
jgi:hypothetical protein